LCALHWIGRNAKEYKFDLGKLVVTGGSAGGHLALTTGAGHGGFTDGQELKAFEAVRAFLVGVGVIAAPR
jgi:hypothetical protein